MKKVTNKKLGFIATNQVFAWQVLDGFIFCPSYMYITALFDENCFKVAQLFHGNAKAVPKSSLFFLVEGGGGRGKSTGEPFTFYTSLLCFHFLLLD